MQLSGKIVIVRLAAGAAAIAGLFVFMPAASAQVCAYNSTQATCACPTSGPGVSCGGGQLYNATAPNCRADVRPCTSFQQFNCATTSCQCNTALYPCGGCTQAASSTPNVTTCSNPINGRYTDQCSASCACASGTTLCAASNTCVTNLACPAGTSFDSCTNSCSSPYILKDQVTAQSAYINITGNITSTAGNLYLTGTGASQGDVYLPSGKAIRVDGAGATALNVGNYGGGTFALNVAGTLVPTGLRIVTGAAAGRVLTSDASGNATWAAAGSGLPAGTINQTLYHNGTAWTASNVLRNTGTTVEVATTSAAPNDIGTNLTLRRTFDALNESTGFGAQMAFNLGGTAAASITGRMTSGAPWRSGGISFQTLDPSGSVERVRIGMINPGNGIAPFSPALSIGNGTIAAGFNVDLRNTWNAGTAIMNVSNENATRLWSGFRIARGAPSSERWFLGMNNADESFRIRRNSTTDDLTIDAATGKVTVASLQITGGATAGSVLTSDASGNATWAAASAAGACGGRQLIGFTAAYTGNLNNAAVNGYDAADVLCNNTLPAATFSGSKVCTSEEVMNSYKCNAPFARNAANNGAAWVNAGPPGYTAWSNDCNAWTKAAADPGPIPYYGRVWELNAATAGRGAMTVCTASIRFACCK